MTRQYKSTDEELREHQAKLSTRIDKNQEEIEALQKRKDEIVKEKEALKTAKDAETSELTAYIDGMHQNFSTMLKATLAKMKARIKSANEAWEDEQDNKLIDKFKEIIDNG